MPDFQSRQKAGEELDRLTPAAQNLKLYSVLEKSRERVCRPGLDTKTDFQRKSNPGAAKPKEPLHLRQSIRKKRGKTWTIGAYLF